MCSLTSKCVISVLLSKNSKLTYFQALICARLDPDSPTRDPSTPYSVSMLQSILDLRCDAPAFPGTIVDEYLQKLLMSMINRSDSRPCKRINTAPIGSTLLLSSAFLSKYCLEDFDVALDGEGREEASTSFLFL